MFIEDESDYGVRKFPKSIAYLKSWVLIQSRFTRLFYLNSFSTEMGEGQSKSVFFKG